MRVGIVSSYPSNRSPGDGCDAVARELVAGGASVVFCALGRSGRPYPDEVVTVVGDSDPTDFVRAGRLLAEHGVDVALIRLDAETPVPHGARELVRELRRHSVAVVVELPAEPGLTWARTVAGLTADATRVVVPTAEAGVRAVNRRLTTVDRLHIGPPAGAVAGCRAVSAMAAPPARTDWLDRDLFGLRSSQADRDARLAIVAARLLDLPAPVLAPIGWRAASDWAGRAVRALGATVGAEVGPGAASRAVRGLGAIAGAAGVADGTRHRAAVLRAMLVDGAPPARLDHAADVVIGLVSAAPLADGERAALNRSAVRLDDARRRHGRRAGWPCFDERLEPGHIRLAHALAVAGDRLRDEAMRDRGIEAVDWLARRAGLATVDGPFLAPVGGPAYATEVGDYVEALAATYQLTGAARHARMAQQALAWFHGANPSGQLVYDEAVGACRAGIGSTSAMAAYSTRATLTYLAAVLALEANGLARLPAAELYRQDLAPVA